MGDQPFTFWMESGDWYIRSTLEERDWIEVSGGGLESPVMIACARTEDGRFVVNGLIVGAGFPRPEITANTLRRIPIAKMLGQLWDGFNGDKVPTDEDFDELIAWGLMHQLGHRQDWLPVVSRAGARKVEDDALELFATVFKEERTRRSHGAMSRAAARLHIHRSTAYRWLALCREKGFLSSEARSTPK